jgi:hypothetical protein
VNRADSDPAPSQSAKDERKKPGLVADVPHDAKRARFMASPAKTESPRQGHGPQICAYVSAVCGFVGIANP